MAEIDSLDYLFVAPSSSVHRIQEAQTTMYHALWELTLGQLQTEAEVVTLCACGIPGELIEFVPDHPDLAKVDVSGVKRVINVGLLADDPPEAGRVGAHPRRVRALQDRRSRGGGRPGVPRGDRAGLRRTSWPPCRNPGSNRSVAHAVRR